jgi:hypothetical protein
MDDETNTPEVAINEQTGCFRAVPGELSDEALGMVSGGCRKAGGDTILKGWQPIISI